MEQSKRIVFNINKCEKKIKEYEIKYSNYKNLLISIYKKGISISYSTSLNKFKKENFINKNMNELYKKAFLLYMITKKRLKI